MRRLIEILFLVNFIFAFSADSSALSKLECYHNPKDAIVLVPNGYNKLYNRNRQILMMGEFKNGKIVNGKEFVYDRNGLLDFIRIYENKRYVRDEFLESDIFRKFFNDVKYIHKNMLFFHWRNLKTLIIGVIQEFDFFHH